MHFIKYIKISLRIVHIADDCSDVIHSTQAGGHDTGLDIASFVFDSMERSALLLTSSEKVLKDSFNNWTNVHLTIFAYFARRLTFAFRSYTAELHDREGNVRSFKSLSSHGVACPPLLHKYGPRFPSSVTHISRSARCVRIAPEAMIIINDPRECSLPSTGQSTNLSTAC